MEVNKINEKTGESEKIRDLYTEYEVQAKINEAKAMQKEEMDYSVSKMREEFEKELQTRDIKYNEIAKSLQSENKFYKEIIKSVLHIKE